MILIAKRTGRVRIGGSPRMIRKGVTTAHADADIVRSHPHLWGPLHVDYAGPDTEALEGEAPDAQLARLEAFLVLDGPDGRPEDEGPVDTAIRLLRPRLDAEPLAEQVDRLATFILERCPGYPSASEGAIDTAIRIIDEHVLADAPDPAPAKPAKKATRAKAKADDGAEA